MALSSRGMQNKSHSKCKNSLGQNTAGGSKFFRSTKVLLKIDDYVCVVHGSFLLICHIRFLKKQIIFRLNEVGTKYA